MSVKLTLTLDDRAYAIASGIFPDGAVWLKVTDALPSFAHQMRIRAAAMRDMNDFMLLAQLVDAVRHQTDVRVSHLELPRCRGRARPTYGGGRQLCAEGFCPSAQYVAVRQGEGP